MQLSALGVAISSMVTLAEILKNKRLAVEKRIVTSLEEISSDCRTRHKPKMSVTLVKSPEFDDILAAESAGKESRDGSSSCNTHKGYDDEQSSGFHVGPRQYVGRPGPGHRQDSLQQPGNNDRSDPHGLRGGGTVGRGYLGSTRYARDGQLYGIRVNSSMQHKPQWNEFSNHINRGGFPGSHQSRPDGDGGHLNGLGQRGIGSPDYALHFARLQQQQSQQLRGHNQDHSYDALPLPLGPTSDNIGSNTGHTFGTLAPNRFDLQQPQLLAGGQQPRFGSYANAMQQQQQHVHQLQEQLAAAQQLQGMEDTRQLEHNMQQTFRSSPIWPPNDHSHILLQDHEGWRNGLQLNQEQLLLLQQEQQQQQPDAMTAQFGDLSLKPLQLPQGASSSGNDGV